MRTLRNKLTLIAILFALACMPLAAQPPRGPHRPPMEKGRGSFDPGKFRAEAEKFISSKAGLTPDEARRFFPMFHELKKQHRDIRGKIRRAMERVEDGRLTDQDARRIMAEVRRLKRQESNLDSEYYVRFERILSPRKLLKVMHADQELRRKMFRNGRR